MPAVGTTEPAATGSVAPPSGPEHTVALPVAEAADAAAAQGDSTQVLPTVSTDESAATDDGGPDDRHGTGGGE